MWPLCLLMVFFWVPILAAITYKVLQYAFFQNPFLYICLYYIFKSLYELLLLLYNAVYHFLFGVVYCVRYLGYFSLCIAEAVFGTLLSVYGRSEWLLVYCLSFWWLVTSLTGIGMAFWGDIIQRGYTEKINKMTGKKINKMTDKKINRMTGKKITEIAGRVREN